MICRLIATSCSPRQSRLQSSHRLFSLFFNISLELIGSRTSLEESPVFILSDYPSIIHHGWQSRLLLQLDSGGNSFQLRSSAITARYVPRQDPPTPSSTDRTSCSATDAWHMDLLVFPRHPILPWSDEILPFSIPTLVREALDPVVNPNAQSMHMHRIIVSHALLIVSIPAKQTKLERCASCQGGSNFAAAYNFDDLNASPCSTVELQADKSNYWMVSSCLH